MYCTTSGSNRQNTRLGHRVQLEWLLVFWLQLDPTEAVWSLVVAGHCLGYERRDANLFARQNLRSFEVATVGEHIQGFFTHSVFGSGRYVGQLRTIMTEIHDLVRDNEMMFGIHRDLNVLADDTSAPTAGFHGARVGIRQRELFVRRFF